MDFIADRATDGQKLWWFSLMDEFTRECLALDVCRRATAGFSLGSLQRVVAERDAPHFLRSDRSKHLAANKVQRWLEANSIRLILAEPASPRQNARVEAFHRRMRDEFLAVDLFTTMEEARRLTER